MANTLTLTSLTELIYAARDKVARECVGFIPSVLVNSSTEGVSINGTVTSHVTAQPTLNTSYTPAMTIPAADDQTISSATMTIGQVANVRFPMTGENAKQLENTAGYEKVMNDVWANAFRKIVNAIELHVATVAYKGSSRAVGTAGTTPFASNFSTINLLRQILQDNGAPVDSGELRLVANTAAGAALRNLSQLQKVNEAGNSDLLRRGVLTDISGFQIRESAQVVTTTAGTGASYQTNSTGLVTDTTAIPADTGSGTILAGDVVTFASGAGSGRNYVVGTALSGGSFSLNAPGLRGAIADNNAITVGSAYTANLGFVQNAIELVMRPPAQPYGGDAAVDRMTLSDDVSGLVFEIAQYKGYGMAMFDISVFYQAKVWKPEFVATLMG